MSAGRRALLAGGLAFGLAARAVAYWVAPAFGYLPDHLDGMAWSTWARTHGPLAAYDMEPELVPLLRAAPDPRTGEPATYLAFAPHAFNYPPFSAWVFWLKGVVWHAVDDDVRRVPAPPTLRALLERRGLPPTLQLRTVNTRLTRLIDGAPGLAFEVLLALGVAALVQRLGGSYAAAFVLVFAAPAVFLDAALWGQSDAWLGAMLVWCLVWWLAGRYTAAGAAYGLALVTKPQAILFAPVLAYALVALRARPGGSWRALRAVVAAAAIVAAVAAPFMIRDLQVGQGAWRWLERSYVGTIGSSEYAFTTMNAFNVWWLDLLRQRPWAAAGDWWRLLDSTAPLFGVSKDTVGVLLLAAALAAGAFLCARRLRWTDVSCLVFAFLVLLSAFLLPTRVHERYVFYCVPFVTALAVLERRWRVPWAVMSVVGTMEMLSHLWVAPTGGTVLVSGAAAVTAVGVLPYALLASGRPRA